MAKDRYERVHDAAQAYIAAYTEKADYTGDKPRRGAGVNIALDELSSQIDAAVAERDEEDAAEGTGEVVEGEVTEG